MRAFPSHHDFDPCRTHSGRLSIEPAWTLADLVAYSGANPYLYHRAADAESVMRLLFVCGRNRLRSPTAERIFAGVSGVEVLSAGISPDADEPVSAELIAWADVVFVMESSHRTKLARKFAPHLRGKRVVCLGIADNYGFMDPELIKLLWDRVPRSVSILAEARPKDIDVGA